MINGTFGRKNTYQTYTFALTYLAGLEYMPPCIMTREIKHISLCVITVHDQCAS